MNALTERRQEDKDRRRKEILDAAETIAARHGWDATTMDEVARSGRLSRALLYVYFQDKQDLMFAIGERALLALKQRLAQALARYERGRDRIEEMSRTYVAFAREFPVYFAVLARCELSSPDAVRPDTNEGRCVLAGDAVQNLLIHALTEGVQDGSIRADAGEPHTIAIVLWGFLHGVIQLITNKVSILTHRGVNTHDLIEQAIAQALRSIAPNI